MRIIIIHVLCSDGKVRVRLMCRFPDSNGIYCYNVLPTIRKRVTKKMMRNLLVIDEKYSVDLEIDEELYKRVYDSFIGLNYKAEKVFYAYDLVL